MATVNKAGPENQTGPWNAHNGGGNGSGGVFHDCSEEGTTLTQEDLQALYGYGYMEIRVMTQT